MRHILATLGIALLAFLASLGDSQSAWSQIWTGAGDGVTWHDGSNWDNGIAPLNPGEFAFFDGSIATVNQPIQLTGNIAISGIELLPGSGQVIIADDEPFNPSFSFSMDNGPLAQIDLHPGLGTSFTFAESLDSFTLASDLVVNQHSPLGVFAIRTSIQGGRTLFFGPSPGRVELTGPVNNIDDLFLDNEVRLGDFNPDGSQDFFLLTGDMVVAPQGNVILHGHVNAQGNLQIDNFLTNGFESSMQFASNLGGVGHWEIFPFSNVQVAGHANNFSGLINITGGNLSVGGAFGGVPGQVIVQLQHESSIGTTSIMYNPTTDPTIMVDPSVINPGSVGLSIDVAGFGAVPGMIIDTNFNNGVDNAYRLGSSTFGSIALGTPILPFDPGFGTAMYVLGGEGRLEIETTLTDSLLSGVSAGIIMPAYPVLNFGVNSGAIALNAANTFTGPVLVEQGQLVLGHVEAVAFAGSVDVGALIAQFDGGNFQHGTLVLDPALLGLYQGPAPNLFGGALGFTLPHTLDFWPTATGLLTPASFDATGFGGGSPSSNLMALGGSSVITQAPGFAISDGLNPSGDPVILVATDEAFVRLTQPNFHSGGTAIVGHSTLEISNPNQLGSGPINIASGATLRITTDSMIPNPIDLHDAFVGGQSGIDTVGGIGAFFTGMLTTDSSPGGTFQKRGTGMLVFDPAVPWSPAGGSNAWGIRIAEGEVDLHQLPEFVAGTLPAWNVGPLMFEGTHLALTARSSTVTNATDPNNTGFRYLESQPGSDVHLTVETGAELKLAGVGSRNQIFGQIIKQGQGELWLGGDSSGGDAVGSRYDGRGDLNIVEGVVRVGNMPGTDNAARAFPDDIVLRIQDGAALIKEQDQPGRVQSLYINDMVGGGTANMMLFGGSPAGDGSLNVNLNSLGSLMFVGNLNKLGNAPLRFSAATGADIQILPGATMEIIDGTVEVDGSGIDPFTDVNTGVSVGVNNNSFIGGFHVTGGTVRVDSLQGAGRTRVEAGARLEANAPALFQNRYEVNGELTAPVIVVQELLTGRGIIDGHVDVMTGAAIAPNDDIDPTRPTPATLSITGDVMIQPGSEINFDLDGATMSGDFLDIGGMAALDGELTLDILSPLPGLGLHTMVLLHAAGGITSQFATTPSVGDYLGFGVEFAGLTYSTNDVLIELNQAAHADFNYDLDVDQLDLDIWQLNFGLVGTAQHSDGDADLDGTVDGSDFLIWQQQFGTTFPPAPISPLTPVNVPEPSGVLLMLLGVVSMVGPNSARRRR